MTIRVYTLFAILAVTSACFRKADMSQPHVAFADKFARALAEGRFDKAHRMLAEETKKELPLPALEKEYDEMIAHGSGSAKHVEVMQTMSRWPDKKKGDVGWVYVTIAGDSFSEAVTVVVAQIDARLAIRSVEWGRP